MENSSNCKKSKYGILTMNNPPEDWVKVISDLYESGAFSYIGGQLEQGVEGTRHIQMFCVGADYLSLKFFGKK